MINIINSCSLPRLPIKKAKETIESVLSAETELTYSIDLIYVDSDYIAELNMNYLSHEGDTDVITFSLGEDDTIEGEIYVCPQVAIEQAKEYNVSMNEELLRLAAHGALHLCGYDDDTDENRQKMHILETKYMKI